MINEPLLRQTVKYIENNPEGWNQAQFESHETCGTTRCLAGWAIALHHGEFTDIYKTIPFDYNASQYAAELLGLTETQEERLFYYYDDDINSFKKRITEYTGVEFKTNDNT